MLLAAQVGLEHEPLALRARVDVRPAPARGVGVGWEWGARRTMALRRACVMYTGVRNVPPSLSRFTSIGITCTTHDAWRARVSPHVVVVVVVSV